MELDKNTIVKIFGVPPSALENEEALDGLHLWISGMEGLHFCISDTMEIRLCNYVSEKNEKFGNTVAAPEWIYCDHFFGNELDETIQNVEKALGFKLFVWQKHYIESGRLRKTGATTAKILKELLDVGARPLDYSAPAQDPMERFYRAELRKIKEKLDDAGIPTRTVFFTKKDKKRWVIYQNE